MNYVDQNLIRDEIVIFQTGLHWMTLMGSTLFAGFLLIIATGLIASGDGNISLLGVCSALLACGIIGISILRRSSVEMAVTNKRVIIKSGFLRRRSLEIYLQKVESIAVDQGLMGRMFGYGSIVVGGTGGTAEPFHKVRSPLEFRRRVQEQSEAITKTQSLTGLSGNSASPFPHP
jgi:uncharacterized membrane protein YdbT with pleckstrin-like domain